MPPAGRGARLEEFATFPDRLRAAAEASGAPGPHGSTAAWGPAEVVRHLLATESLVHQPRLEQLRAEAAPLWRYTAPELGTTEDAPLPELLALFADARAATIALIRGLDAGTWGRVAIHETFGPLDVDGLIDIAADHDAEHLGDL